MPSFARLAAPLTALRRSTADPSTGNPAEGTRPARRRSAGVAAGVAVAVLAGGTTAVAVAHKTVTLDVDGEVREVSTFAGSVDGVLSDAGIDVGTRDTVAPDLATALGDGSQVVVRHARQVQVAVDGAETSVWTTALNADEALGVLSARGGDVSLVASRSQGTGRAELPIELDGPLEVAVDGATHAVADGSQGLPAVLDGLGVALNALDRVSVRHSETGTVTVVVNRVVVQDVPEDHPIAFGVVEQPDAGRFVGTKDVVTPGAEGIRTVVNRITTVDGAETARQLLSDTVTREPVTQVVAVGTKPKPVPKPAPAPAAAPRAAQAPAARAAQPSATPAAPARSGGLNWAALAACESGGRPTVVSASGRYHGLYQFSVATWRSVGGAGLPSQASPAEQTARAQMLFDRSGPGQWPHCGPRLFS